MLRALLFGVFLSALGALAVGPGEPAPALDQAVWLRGPAPVWSEHPVTVVCFWRRDSELSQQAIARLAELRAAHPDSGCAVAMITGEDPAALESLAVDPKWPQGFLLAQGNRDLHRAYLDAELALPHCFLVDREGRTLWRGSPFAAGMPLAQVLAGRYDLAAAVQVRQLSQALEAAILGRDVDKIREAAEQVLTIDKAHARALQVLGFMAMNADDPAGFRALHEGIDLAAVDADTARRLALDAVTNPRLPYRLPGFAMKAIQRALEDRPRDPAFLATYALVLSVVGDLDGAIREQEAAMAAAGEKPAAVYGQTLDYYREAKAARQQLVGQEGMKQ